MSMGDIYLVDFPVSDGHEQTGSRPAVILIEFPELPIVQIIPLTSREQAKNYKHTVVIQGDEENHLDKTSIALLFQLRAIDKRRLKMQLGKLKEKDIEQLKMALKAMYGF
jgi:mRNA interferase MazF